MRKRMGEFRVTGWYGQRDPSLVQVNYWVMQIDKIEPGSSELLGDTERIEPGSSEILGDTNGEIRAWLK